MGRRRTAEDMKDYIWLKPEIVAEIKFTEWDHRLRLVQEGHRRASQLRRHSESDESPRHHNSVGKSR